MRRCALAVCVGSLLAMSMLVPSPMARGASDRLSDANHRRAPVEQTAQKLMRHLVAPGRALLRPWVIRLAEP